MARNSQVGNAFIEETKGNYEGSHKSPVKSVFSSTFSSKWVVGVQFTTEMPANFQRGQCWHCIAYGEYGGAMREKAKSTSELCTEGD
jgi:hypothetical protein